MYISIELLFTYFRVLVLISSLFILEMLFVMVLCYCLMSQKLVIIFYFGSFVVTCRFHGGNAAFDMTLLFFILIFDLCLREYIFI